MGKYIHYFKNESDFTDKYYGEEYLEPWVSLTDTENEHVDYNKGYVGVDLGLPSGNRWAEYNIGTDDPLEPGNYYAWAETSTKENFTFGTYKYANPVYDGAYTKYIYDDGLTKLEPGDDAAHTELGGNWWTPTYDDFVELLANCTVTKAQDPESGKYYATFTSNINGNSIRFSDYKVMYEASDGRSEYSLWASEIGGTPCYPGGPYTLYGSLQYNDSPRVLEETTRYYGRPIRPVFKF